MVIAYVLTQTPESCNDLIPMLYAVQQFANEQLFDECAPLATFESAINVIKFEFEQNIINDQSFANQIDPLVVKSNMTLKRIFKLRRAMRA